MWSVKIMRKLLTFTGCLVILSSLGCQASKDLENCQQENSNDAGRKQTREFLDILEGLVKLTQQRSRDNHRDYERCEAGNTPYCD